MRLILKAFFTTFAIFGGAGLIIGGGFLIGKGSYVLLKTYGWFEWFETQSCSIQHTITALPAIGVMFIAVWGCLWAAWPRK